ncbi:MAG: phosphoadenylyl-sulfate reductase [Anaerolineae bacterium]|nr:phosphoadenylyl-sulfate reductase [Anaerolineae bacterium]
MPLLNKRFAHSSAEEILQWAWDTFGSHVTASSSFQTQSVPLLHLISQVCPEMPVIFLDTGFHFPETLAFRDNLHTRFGLNLVIVRPAIEKSQLADQYGAALYRRDPDLCCYIHKVEPMQRALAGFEGWISGIRRDQTANRQNLPVLETQPTGPLKIYPLLEWTRAQIDEYIQRHQLPTHPLFAKGYRSIGCAPCTRPVLLNEDDRAGRWAGIDKNECGLHLNLMDNVEEGTP